MPENRTVISNTTPLLYLHQINRLELLERLYGIVHVPKQVVDELQAGNSENLDVASVNWLKIENSLVPESLRMIPDLGLGEAGVIGLAFQSPSPLLLIDDALAREIAMLNDISYSGTAGVLIKCKGKGILPAVRPILLDLINAGFYLRPRHYEMMCQIAGE